MDSVSILFMVLALTVFNVWLYLLGPSRLRRDVDYCIKQISLFIKQNGRFLKMHELSAQDIDKAFFCMRVIAKSIDDVELQKNMDEEIARMKREREQIIQ